MNFRIQADLTDQQLEALYRLGPTFSPGFESATNGVPVTATAERMYDKSACMHAIEE